MNEKNLNELRRISTFEQRTRSNNNNSSITWIRKVRKKLTKKQRRRNKNGFFQSYFEEVIERKHTRTHTHTLLTHTRCWPFRVSSFHLFQLHTAISIDIVYDFFAQIFKSPKCSKLKFIISKSRKSEFTRRQHGWNGVDYLKQLFIFYYIHRCIIDSRECCQMNF